MNTKQNWTGLYEELNTMRIVFWHPFGPSGGESAEEILNRKRHECVDTGETFWTFGSRRTETVKFWRDQIRRHNGVVSVLCVYRDTNKDSKKKSIFVDATFWQEDKEREDTRQLICPGIRATIKRGALSGAFIVYAVDILEPHAYLRRKGKLLRPGFGDPTGPMGRGQKLVRFGGGKNSREWKGGVAAILRLKEPWVVWIGKS